MCLLYAFATGFSALAMCRSLPLGTHRISAIFTFFAGAAMSMALLWLALGYLWNEILLALQYPWAGLYFSSNLSWLIVALGILLYGLMVTLHYLWIEYERAQQARAARNGFQNDGARGRTTHATHPNRPTFFV